MKSDNNKERDLTLTWSYQRNETDEGLSGWMTKTNADAVVENIGEGRKIETEKTREKKRKERKMMMINPFTSLTDYLGQKHSLTNTTITLGHA